MKYFDIFRTKLIFLQYLRKHQYSWRIKIYLPDNLNLENLNKCLLKYEEGFALAMAYHFPIGSSYVNNGQRNRNVSSVILQNNSRL